MDGVSISATSATLSVGSSLQLTAEVTHNNATQTGLVWSSSNPSVAAVNQNGLVTAVGMGSNNEVVITATAMDGSGKSVSCTVNVDPAYQDRGVISQDFRRAHFEITLSQYLTPRAKP